MSTGHVSRECKGQTKSGKPCPLHPLKGSVYCWNHDPDRVTQRAQARKKGGQARQGRVIFPSTDSAPVNIETVADVLALIERAINDALALENSINRARVLGGLAGVALKALETGILEERISALEAKLLEGSKS